MIKLLVESRDLENGKKLYYSTIKNKYRGVNTYYQLLVNFKKGTEPKKDKVLIDINKFWFGCYPYENYAKLKIIVTDYKVIEREEHAFEDYNSEKEEYSDYNNIDLTQDDDIV